jgi:hypothetical protein
MRCVVAALAFVVALSASWRGQAQDFKHPGLFSTSADLQRLKRAVAAGEEPYLAGWNKLKGDSHASLSYQARPRASVARMPSAASYDALINDAIAAHLHAVAYAITGQQAHADKAAEILDAWSGTLTSFPSDGDPVLSSGLTGYQLAAASELLRATYPAWPAERIARVKNVLSELLYPPNHNFLIYHEPDGLPHTKTGVNQHFFASWDAIAATTVAAIGVFTDDRAKYQEAIDYFKHGTGNGAIERAVFDAATGQLQESGRDPEHAQLGLGLLASLCEIAWNQGDDLYGYADNRLLKGFEYTASYLLGNAVPFAPYSDPYRSYSQISSESSPEQLAQSRTSPRPIYEMVWNHYQNRRGVAAPYTEQLSDRFRPEGFRADHLGFGTLLFTREREVAGQAPGSSGAASAGMTGDTAADGGSAATGASGADLADAGPGAAAVAARDASAAAGATATTASEPAATAAPVEKQSGCSAAAGASNRATLALLLLALLGCRSRRRSGARGRG